MIEMLSSPQFWVSVLQIIAIDLLLSGDNAVVIALACRNLPPEQRRKGVMFGVSLVVAPSAPGQSFSNSGDQWFWLMMTTPLLPACVAVEKFAIEACCTLPLLPLPLWVSNDVFIDPS